MNVRLTSANPVVHEEMFDDALEFIDALRMTDDRWSPLEDHASPWVFRGQSDAQWSLQPKAWRADGREVLQPVMERLRPGISEWFGRMARESPQPPIPEERAFEFLLTVATEIDAVRQFSLLSDELGFEVPDAHEVPLPLMQIFQGFPAHHWESVLQPNTAFALAQHHQIPTRLLDVTRRPLVAAFFAAEGIATLPRPPESIAVWALNTHFNERRCRLRTMACPRHKDDFVHAQDALFVWDVGADRHFLEQGQWPEFAEIVGTAVDAFTSLPLRKLVLPVEQVPRLLQLLWRERISRAHLMPNYDNVTEALRVKWGWK